jgi:lysozyme
MRLAFITVLSFLLMSCGGSEPPEQAVSKTSQVNVSTTNVRVADSDRTEWSGTRPWRYPVHGIDVSKYQGDIDWRTAGRGGVSFAYIKATEGGDHLDDKFSDNWQASRRAGVLRGAYHFYYFCRTAAEQANWFIQNVPRDAKALPPVLDMEWNHKSRTCKYRPSPAKVRSEMRVYLARVNGHYGKRPIIYVTPDFYQENQLWKIRGYSFWLRSVADHPSRVYRGQPWAFWQYTGTGHVPGIDGKVDINAFSGSLSAWKEWAGSNTQSAL